MNTIEHNEGITALQDIMDKHISKVLETLKDKSIPLDERWDQFTKLCKSVKMPNQSWGDGFIRILSEKLTMYDDFYIDRHETVNYIDLYERLGNLEIRIPEENIAKWKEAVLQSGDGSFTHDW